MKKLLPQSILWRFTLITLCPIILLQVVSLYFFLHRHVAAISETMSFSVISQVNQVVKQIEKSRLDTLNETGSYPFKFKSVEAPVERHKTNSIAAKTLRHFLYHHMDREYVVSFTDPDVMLYVKTKFGWMLFEIPKKNIFSSTSTVFTILILVIPLLLFVIAQLFLKNQLKPIIELSETMKNLNNFATDDQIFITPSGSQEIRTLITSFNTMVSQIRRFFMDRSLMLAGISHDLRTYLTRIKLQLAMLDKNQSSKFDEDIASMETVLEQFLKFSKNQHAKLEKCKIDIIPITQKLITQLQKTYDLSIELTADTPEIRLLTDVSALTRCMLNIIDNSARYASKLVIRITQDTVNTVIALEDNGPGIPDTEISKIITPFYKIDQSRKLNGSSGLGLSIVQNTVDSLGGKLTLSRSDLGGLKVMITLKN